MVAARAFGNFKQLLLEKPINNFSKYIRIGLLAASRFSRTQFWSDLINYLLPRLIFFM